MVRNVGGYRQRRQEAVMASRGPGLTSRGNRILLAVVVTWLVWFVSRALEVPTLVQWVVCLMIGVGVYVLATVLAAQRAR
jgi:hypothetical protein